MTFPARSPAAVMAVSILCARAAASASSRVQARCPRAGRPWRDAGERNRGGSTSAQLVAVRLRSATPHRPAPFDSHAQPRARSAHRVPEGAASRPPGGESFRSSKGRPSRRVVGADRTLDFPSMVIHISPCGGEIARIEAGVILQQSGIRHPARRASSSIHTATGSRPRKHRARTPGRALDAGHARLARVPTLGFHEQNEVQHLRPHGFRCRLDFMQKPLRHNTHAGKCSPLIASRKPARPCSEAREEGLNGRLVTTSVRPAPGFAPTTASF